MGCWYIECRKTIYPVEEEEVKISYDKVVSRGPELGSEHIKVPEEVTKVDLALLLKKKKNKIFNQKTRNAKKATEKL